MQVIHVRNLEKFNPGYQDRDLIWCKAYFKMINADPEFEMLCEIDKWRFLAFVMLELQTKKPIPYKEDYLLRKGFDFKKRKLSETVKSLSQSIEVINVTHDLETCNESVTQSREEKSREEKSREDSRARNRIYEEMIFLKWNTFADKHRLSKIKEITPEREARLGKRLGRESFHDFDSILTAISEQPFLMGENDRKWVITFDWLLENDTNYMKVLERKYKTDTKPTNEADKWKTPALR